MRFHSHFQFYFINVFPTFFRFILTFHFKCGQRKYRSKDWLGHVSHLGHGFKIIIIPDAPSAVYVVEMLIFYPWREIAWYYGHEYLRVPKREVEKVVVFKNMVRGLQRIYSTSGGISRFIYHYCYLMSAQLPSSTKYRNFLISPSNLSMVWFLILTIRYIASSIWSSYHHKNPTFFISLRSHNSPSKVITQLQNVLIIYTRVIFF